MIDDPVLDLAHALIEYSKHTFSDSPKYILDFSFPSVGLIDLYTSDLKGKKNFNDDDTYLLMCAASYVGCVAYNVWHEFHPEMAVELTINEEGSEITLSAKGGAALPRRARFEVPLVKTLKGILRLPERPFPFFEKTTWKISPETNLVSLFARGLCCGLCPYGDGPWASQTLEDFDKGVQIAESMLAESSATYYKRIFPSEPLGGAQALYETGLLYPPPTYGETHIFSNSLINIIDYCKAAKQTHEQKEALALNLAQSPDEVISSVGFIFAAALTKLYPADKLRALSESFGTRVHRYVPGLILSRLQLGAKDDWPQLLEAGDVEGAKKLLRIEIALNLIPLWRLSDAHFENSDFFPLFIALRKLDAEEASDRVRVLTKLGKLYPDLESQRIYLDIFCKRYEAAADAIETIAKKGLDNYPISPTEYYELAGMLMQHTGDNTEAAKLIAKSLLLAKKGTIRFRTTANSFAEYLIAHGRHDEALEILDVLVKSDPSTVHGRYNRHLALKGLGSEHEAAKELVAASRMTPMDRTVFLAFRNHQEQKVGGGDH